MANLTMNDFTSSIVIYELDSKAHIRQKLIYNVEEVMLGGPHRIDLTQHYGGVVIGGVGIYLHLLQSSIGRDINYIQQPGRIMNSRLGIVNPIL